MQLLVLGSGDAFGNGGRFQTCFALRAEGRAILVDCGATSLTAMKAGGLDPLDVDLVVLSHLHGDHFGGLPFLILDAQFRGRTRPLTVCGPPTSRERLATAMECLYPGSTSVQRKFDLVVRELAPDGSPLLVNDTGVGDVAVRAWEVDHACGAPPLAVRLELKGAALAYSGDTAWTPSLLEASRGADLFLAEAYTWEREVKFHLSHRQVAEHLDDFLSQRILLTHMSPEVLDHMDNLCAEAAQDGCDYPM